MPIISYQTEPFTGNAKRLAQKQLDSENTLRAYEALENTPFFKDRGLVLPDSTAIERPQFSRPNYGFNIKRNRIAFLSVVDAEGKPIPIMGSKPPANTPKGEREMAEAIAGKPVYNRYFTDFIVTTISETRADKVQIIDTFGEAYYFTYGQAPKNLSISGFLFNTEDFNWRTQFWHNYENYLRGSKLAEMNARAYLSFDDVVVEGLILNATSTLQGDSPNLCPFSFQMIVTHYVQVQTARPTEDVPEGNPFTGSVFMLNLPSAEYVEAWGRATLGNYKAEITSIGQGGYPQDWWTGGAPLPSATDMFLKGMWDYISDPTRAANLLASGYDAIMGRGSIRPIGLLTQVVGAGLDNMLDSSTFEGRLLDIIPQLSENKMVQRFGTKLAQEIGEHAALTGDVLDTAITGGDPHVMSGKIGKNLFTMDIF